MLTDARLRPRTDGRPPQGLGCGPSGRARQLPLAPLPAWRWWRSGHAIRAQSTWKVAIGLLIGGLALPGCQEMGDDRAPASSDLAAIAKVPVESGYPPLQSVPPRPQLSYTVQQQRQIVEALIADRENARYTSQVVRHRSGLSSLPPPPEPPEPAPPIPAEPGVASQDGAVPERSLSEQDTLVDFLGALFFGEPDPAEPAEPDGSSELGVPESAAPPDALDRSDDQEPAPAAAGPSVLPSEPEVDQAPVPPARSAVAARLAVGPDVIDQLVDETVPQAPLPPGQPALAARIAATDAIDVEKTTVPLPAPRPATARPAGAALQGRLADPAEPPAPPPTKPILPVSVPVPPIPVERPADDRSAAVQDARQTETTPPTIFVGTQVPLIVANSSS
jgi:hypothetical protein